jgi:propionate CoA-transferase
MDERIFLPKPMGLKDDLVSLPLEDRFTYDHDQNLFFVNLEGHMIKTLEDVEQVRKIVETRLAPLDKKVSAIVNYDDFVIMPDVLDAYIDMVKDLVERFYSGVTRYTTSTFLRMKLGDALKQRHVSPHIYETQDEARRHLRDLRIE